MGSLRRLPGALRRDAPVQDALRRRAVCDGDDATTVVIASCLQAAEAAFQVDIGRSQSSASVFITDRGQYLT